MCDRYAHRTGPDNVFSSGAVYDTLSGIPASLCLRCQGGHTTSSCSSTFNPRMSTSQDGQPIILGSINPSKFSLSLSPSYSNQFIILYASGLVINLVNPVSLRLIQSIHVIDHLPHLSNYQPSVDAVCLTEDNQRLAASCGPLTAIFESSSSIFPTSWKLHSTFTCHISRILSIDLKQSYCLATGKDGLSLHQLEEEETSDSDQPARWIKRWAVRGQPSEQSTFDILDDGTCLIVTTVLGSPVLRAYEFSISLFATPLSPQPCSPKTIALSLPIRSIRLFYRQSPPSNQPHALPCLSVEVVAPVIGTALHYFNLVRRPLAIRLGNPDQQQHLERYKPKVQYLHQSMCAISVPANAPRILACFPLDRMAQHFILHSQQKTGQEPHLNVILLSDGQVHLARSTKNTTLLSTNPPLLSDDMLDLFKRSGTKIQSVMSVNSSNGQPENLSLSIVVRPLTPTGEIFVSQIPLGAFLARPTAASSYLRLVSTKRLPYGHMPLFASMSYYETQHTSLANLLITASTKHRAAQDVCLCNVAEDKSRRVTRLLAYAAHTEQAMVPQNTDLTGKFEALGCLNYGGCYCKSGPTNLIAENSRFLAMLYAMSETDRTRTYRVVILDLRQHPYSPGIVGLDTFEVEKSSVGTGNKTQLKWSDYKNGAHSFHGDCSLGVCCGADVVRIYTRAIHGWWTCTSNVHSHRNGSISQICWLTSADQSTRLIYQTAGHTLLGPPISHPERLTLAPWHPTLLKNQFLFGRRNLSVACATVACLSLALDNSLQPLTLLCQRIVTVGLEDDGALIVKELEDLANDFVLPENLSPTILSPAHVDIIESGIDDCRIPLLSEHEQASLLHLAEALLQVQKARSHGIDMHGCQYIFSLINHLKNPTGCQSDVDLGFGPDQDTGILSAQLSSTRALIAQETCTILSKYAANPGSRLDWKVARSAGLFLWLDTLEEVHSYLERIAQAEYVSGGGGNDPSTDKLRTSDGPREQDPAACSIFYMALKKKRLLMGLWKVAYGHADRPLMTKFLENDFSEARWKTAAQKNAFALLSRQRFRFAASFFLLADRLQDAVNVCVRQLSDWQLALAIVRAYQGDRGPAMDKLLTETVLPLGFSSGNRWLVSWSFRMLGEMELACRILVVSIQHFDQSLFHGAWDDPLIRNRWTPSVHATSAVRMGPLDLSLVLLFNCLKRGSRSPLRWTDERELFLLTVDELTNAGGLSLSWCAVLAAALAKTWHIDRPDLLGPRLARTAPDPCSNDQQLQPLGSAPNPFSNPRSSSSIEAPLPPPKKNVLTQPVVPEFEMSSFF
ncbi:hypothetical protein VP01_2815g2 [Puccinia sorghi]|uniref:RAVE complex protein Rav1 C-terminal domain-containing protein n=1 Tax=Puccinia sorghi TaxID=27349 RepID=A0A0L6V2F1_9BASI|nr:hypothetical protein VP01_2815g2 [Puccinia sorghi]